MIETNIRGTDSHYLVFRGYPWIRVLQFTIIFICITLDKTYEFACYDKMSFKEKNDIWV